MTSREAPPVLIGPLLAKHARELTDLGCDFYDAGEMGIFLDLNDVNEYLRAHASDETHRLAKIITGIATSPKPHEMATAAAAWQIMQKSPTRLSARQLARALQKQFPDAIKGWRGHGHGSLFDRLLCVIVANRYAGGPPPRLRLP